MYKIIITGPESSGKTTLCKKLCSYYNLTYIEEFARTFFKEKESVYNQNDLLEIAKGQILIEKKTEIIDTDLITIKIWSEWKYGSCHPWILEKIEKQKYDKRIYLLCKPDIPWKYDKLRENQYNRTELFKMYINELEILNHKYFIVDGNNRVKSSIEKISKIAFINNCNS